MADSSRRPVILSARPPLGLAEGSLDLRARLHLVAQLRQRGSVDRLFQHPRDWADLAGFDVTLTFARTAEDLADPRTVFYIWHHDERERGIRVYCGLSRAFLNSLKIAHTAHDVWRFALDLALPMEARPNGVVRLSRAQPHCPVDVIQDVLAGRW